MAHTICSSQISNSLFSSSQAMWRPVEGGCALPRTSVSPAQREGTQRARSETGVWRDRGAAWGLMQSWSVWDRVGDKRQAERGAQTLSQGFFPSVETASGTKRERVHSAPWWPVLGPLL